MRNIVMGLISLMCCLGVGSIWAEDMRPEDPFSLDSFSDVQAAVDAIVERLESDGFDVALVVNHGANAASVDIELLPTQLIMFRAPKVEKKLIRRQQIIALDFPQKILLWQDPSGALRLKHNSAGYLAERHRLRVRDHSLRRIDRLLQAFEIRGEESIRS